MAKVNQPITADDIEAALAIRYAAPEYAFLPQVRNGTGYSRMTVRTADAVAMSLYPSRGLHLHGFEIKVSRYDWLKELREPAKADEIAKHCHRWWIVVPDCEPKIVADGELPVTWGLLTLKGAKLFCTKDAPVNEAPTIDYLFLAALLRKVHETITPASKMQAEFERGKKEGIEAGEQLVKYELQDHREAIKLFADKSGINILDRETRWLLGNIAEAVKMLVEMKPDDIRRRIKDVRNELDRFQRGCDAVLNSLNGAERDEPEVATR